MAKALNFYDSVIRYYCWPNSCFTYRNTNPEKEDNNMDTAWDQEEGNVMDEGLSRWCKPFSNNP